MNKVAEHETIYDEHVENAIDQARYRIFARRVDWAMKTTFGVSLSQWQRGKVPGGKLDPLLLKAGKLLMLNEDYPLEVIVAGFFEPLR
jgi:hypothetical protein